MRDLTNLLSTFAFCILVGKNAFAQPYVTELQNDPGLHSIHLNFTLDFTYSKQHGIKVIEFGNFETSKYDGYTASHPDEIHPVLQMWAIARQYAAANGYTLPGYMPDDLLDEREAALRRWKDYERNRDAWLSVEQVADSWKRQFEANKAMIYVGGFSAYANQAGVRSRNQSAMITGITQGHERIRSLLASKIYSTLLHTQEDQPFRPVQILVTHDTTKKPGGMEAIMAQIATFPTDEILVKSPISTRGEEIYLTTKAELPIFLEEVFARETKRGSFLGSIPIPMKSTPLLLQSFHPSGSAENQRVGRMSFTAFYDASKKRVSVYPVISYWKTYKMHASPLGHGKKLEFTEKSGEKIATDTQRQLVAQLSQYMSGVFLNAATLNEHGLFGPTPMGQQIVNRIIALPDAQLDALAMLDNGTLLSDEVRILRAEHLASKSTDFTSNAALLNRCRVAMEKMGSKYLP